MTGHLLLGHHEESDEMGLNPGIGNPYVGHREAWPVTPYKGGRGRRGEQKHSRSKPLGRCGLGGGVLITSRGYWIRHCRESPG